MRAVRLPDAVMGEPGPGWEAWEGKGPFTEANPRSVIAPKGSILKVFTRKQDELRHWCWYVVLPTGVPRSIVADKHKVTELPNGLITVSPSIWDHPDGYHGFLVDGEWS